MSAVWFTSDLHIGHEMVAVQRFLPSKIDGTASIGWHDAMLAHRWDENVRPDDQVWVLGDLTLGGTEAVAHGLNWISDRPGVKHLIAGNHDPVHPMHRDAHRWQSAYLKVFASVQAFARRRIAGQDVLLSHFPYEGDHSATERFRPYRLRDVGDPGTPLLHGHTHSAEKISYGRDRWVGIPGVNPTRGPMQIHVGVDAWDMRPVALSEIEGLLDD